MCKSVCVCVCVCVKYYAFDGYVYLCKGMAITSLTW